MTSPLVASAARVRRVVHRRQRRALTVALGVGDRVECPACGWTGRRFMASRKPRRPNRICPGCNATERYRAFELWLEGRGAPPEGARMLEVAPTRVVERAAARVGYRYSSVDLHSPEAQMHADLCALPFGDATFDIVVCFHVLEHIPDDDRAAAELVRVTKPDGLAVVVVPLEPDRAETFEVPDADPADYERLYGQSDHVRIYGRDAPDRWRAPRMVIDEKPWAEEFSEGERRRHALDGDDDRFWILRPRRSEGDRTMHVTTDRQPR